MQFLPEERMRKRDRDGRKRDEARKSIKNSRHERLTDRLRICNNRREMKEGSLRERIRDTEL